MKILMNKKILLISLLVYMALTFLLPIDKTGFNPLIGFKATDTFYLNMANILYLE